jgi:hypothetical protein
MNLNEFNQIKKYIIRESFSNKSKKHINLKKFKNWKLFFLFDNKDYNIDNIIGIVTNNNLKKRLLSYMVLYIDGSYDYFNISKFVFNNELVKEYKLKKAQYNSVKKQIRNYTNNLNKNICYLSNNKLDNNKHIHYESIQFKNICDLFKKNILKNDDWNVQEINGKYILEKNQEEEFIKYHNKWLVLNKNLIKNEEKHNMKKNIKKKIRMLNEFKSKSNLNVLKNKPKMKIYLKKNKLLDQLKNTHQKRINKKVQKIRVFLKKKRVINQIKESKV